MVYWPDPPLTLHSHHCLAMYGGSGSLDPWQPTTPLLSKNKPQPHQHAIPSVNAVGISREIVTNFACRACPAHPLAHACPCRPLLKARLCILSLHHRCCLIWMVSAAAASRVPAAQAPTVACPPSPIHEVPPLFLLKGT